MSRWFRYYDNAMHDPKLLRLSDATFRAWMTLLCFASKNNGILPSAADIAVELRCKPALVASWITELAGAALLDKTGDGYMPHNWNERQYKSDSSAERMKRHRDRKSDVTNKKSDVTVTVQNRTETDTETEQSQKDAEAKASGAGAPRDARTELFNRGLETLARLTGKGPDACRAFVGKCLKAASDDAVTVLGLIEDAERNRVVDASAWIVARLKPSTGPPLRANTVYQQRQLESREILNEIDQSILRRSGAQDTLAIRHDPGDGRAAIRGGPGPALIDLSAKRG